MMTGEYQKMAVHQCSRIHVLQSQNEMLIPPPSVKALKSRGVSHPSSDQEECLNSPRSPLTNQERDYFYACFRSRLSQTGPGQKYHSHEIAWLISPKTGARSACSGSTRRPDRSSIERDSLWPLAEHTQR